MNPHHSHTTPWRWPAAAALSATAAIHLALVPSHLSEAPYAGGLFIAFAVGALTSAILLLTVNRRLIWLTAAGLAAGAIGAYVVSRSAGLPSMADDIGNWLNPLGVIALVCELAVTAITWRVLSTRSRPADPHPAAAQPRRTSRTGPGTSPARSPSV
ncbi:MAG: hypothetical protein QOG59_1414 [Solirubrobacteraceae bacterium]|nr:hypothetical protein [Solirubrobacteraceae bacterium]